ncbi:hypothetical protein IscW_ISCW003163 [Ixodes scapularis]|uniref:Uncharacterized protein n=1 Tax=Ixodes scapularis TaxID=6945 RepID=B7PCU3_IXOSC|nr:hypothetical protein IscW_ISCW003163 [Ixodes scapularis]|eukprot:XP_002410302.1 hypothetical protein IscW_ISCW003163 [Ixodes scapularis]
MPTPIVFMLFCGLQRRGRQAGLSGPSIELTTNCVVKRIDDKLRRRGAEVLKVSESRSALGLSKVPAIEERLPRQRRE